MRHDAVVDWNERDVDTLRKLEWVEESETEASRRSASLVVKGGVAGVDADTGAGGDGEWGIPTVWTDRAEVVRLIAEKREERKEKKIAKKALKKQMKKDRKAERKAKQRATMEAKHGTRAAKERLRARKRLQAFLGGLGGPSC
jgi:hypothetical protein